MTGLARVSRRRVEAAAHLWAGLLCLISSAAASSAQVEWDDCHLRRDVEDSSGGVLPGAT